jgi:prepilin-type processing-associated H-X9-DG protein
MSIPPQQPYQRPGSYDGPPPKKKMPVWGWVLIGCAGIPILLIPIVAAILFPVFAQAREKARQTSCLTNLKQSGLGMMMYAQDYDGKLPPAQGWMDKLVPYMPKDEKAYHCPSAKSSGQEEAYGYAFNSTISTIVVTQLPSPQTTGMIFDSDTSGRSATTKGALYPTPARHSSKNNVAFADGHVKAIGGN